MTGPVGGAPPLSWPQEVLRLAERMRPGTVLDPRCAVHRAFAFPAEPDVPLLGRVLTEVVERHDAVRTVPLPDGAGLRAEPRATRPAEVEVRALPDAPTEEQMRGAVTAAACAPYDLDAGPLLRGTWLRGGSGGVLVLSLHHWAGDAGALDALVRETSDLYAASRHDRAAPPAPPRYSDLARRQRRQPSHGDAAGLAWWRAELDGARRGALPVTGAGRAPGGATALTSTKLHAVTHSALLALTEQHRASPYMVLLAALGGLLDGGRGSGGSADPADPADLTVFGVDVGRSRDTRRMLGFLAEPMPLRLRLDRSEPLGAAIRCARETVLAALRHRDVPFLRLLEAEPRLAAVLLGGRRPATLVQYFTLTGLDLDGLRGKPLPTFQAAVAGERHPAVLPIDLTVTVERCVDGHHAGVLYDPGLWSRDDVEAALSALQHVVCQAAADPSRPLADLVAETRT